MLWRHMVIMTKIKNKISKFFLFLGLKLKELYFFIRPKMKIKNDGLIIFSHDFERGGAQLLLLNIVKTFSSRRFCVVFSETYGPLADDFLQYSSVFIGSAKRNIKKASTLKKRLGYQVAILNTVFCGKYASDLSVLGFKVISLVHEMSSLIHKNRWEKYCDEINACADLIVFPSGYVKESFSNCLIGSLRISKVAVRHQGLFNVYRYDKSKAEYKEYLSKKYGIDLAKRKLIINVATGCYRKGFDLFLEIAKKVSIVRKDIFFIWIGNDVEDISSSLSSDDRKNIFLPGYVSGVECLAPFYGAADLFCLTSREEPFGTIVLEALNAGLPIFSFYGCGGYMDVLADTQNSIFIQPYDTEQYSQEILRSIDSFARMKTIMNDKSKRSLFDFDAYCDFLYETLKE